MLGRFEWRHSARSAARRMPRHRASAVTPLLVLCVAGACASEPAGEREATAAREALAQSETTATRARALPATGLWSEAHLVDRLLRAGVSPRVVEPAPRGPAWMRRAPVVYRAGGGEVYAWIYTDSLERRAVTSTLDPATATPAGAVPPFAAPMRFVAQSNLAAVIVGGSETNQERIALALQAGLPVQKP